MNLSNIAISSFNLRLWNAANLAHKNFKKGPNGWLKVCNFLLMIQNTNIKSVGGGVLWEYDECNDPPVVYFMTAKRFTKVREMSSTLFLVNLVKSGKSIYGTFAMIKWNGDEMKCWLGCYICMYIWMCSNFYCSLWLTTLSMSINKSRVLTIGYSDL